MTKKRKKMTMMMTHKQKYNNALAIETGASAGSVAILKNGKLAALTFLDIKVTHSERLMPAIDFALNNCRMKISDLDAVYFANGPGSFTGIRIGLATAKGICNALNIPLIPINTLTVLAMNCIPIEKEIAVVQDAKMGELYAALYDKDLNEIVAPHNCFPKDFAEKLENRNVVFCGSGFEVYKDILIDQAKEWKSSPEFLNVPLASAMFNIDDRFIDEHTGDKLERLEPFYLRKSQAELVKEKKEKEK
jgi:tRNA threonylcarbamoyladenosine biosynthesis protein TsaB